MHPRPSGSLAVGRLARVFVGVTLAVAAILSAPLAAHAAPPPYGSLAVATTPGSVAVGAPVTLTVDATALQDAYAYTLTIAYDPNVLALDAASAVYPAGGFGTTTPGAGSLTVDVTRLGTSPGLTGDQRLVTLTFTALATGSSPITLTSGAFVNSSTVSTPIATGGPALTSAVAVTGPAPSTPPTQGSSPTPDPATATPVAASAPGRIASTGIDAAPVVLIGTALAAGLIALGTVFVTRRRVLARATAGTRGGDHR